MSKSSDTEIPVGYTEVEEQEFQISNCIEMNKRNRWIYKKWKIRFFDIWMNHMEKEVLHFYKKLVSGYLREESNEISYMIELVIVKYVASRGGWYTKVLREDSFDYLISLT